MVDPRFSQLLQLAKDGAEASVAQLWHEFGFDFHAEVPPSSDIPWHGVAFGEDGCPLSSGAAEGGAQ